MRIYLLCDMEGVSGLHVREQAWFWEKATTPEIHAEGRRLLTDNINAAVAAALAAGADSLVVCECHHGGGNAIESELLSDPRVVYESPAPPRLGPSLDERFDALFLLGHHAKAGTKDAFLPHTWGGDWLDFRVNGQSIGEIGLEACYAGHFGVPVALVQGDEAACAEAAQLLPGVATAAVKRATGFGSAAGAPIEAARALTASKITEAIRKAAAKEVKPFAPRLPMTVTIEMKTVAAAERAAQKGASRGYKTRVAGSVVDAIVERHCAILGWIAGNTA